MSDVCGKELLEDASHCRSASIWAACCVNAEHLLKCRGGFYLEIPAGNVFSFILYSLV